jgi:hypothetical protein
MTDEHDRARAACALACVFRERRFSDAGLAAQENKPALSGEGVAELRVEEGSLTRAPGQEWRPVTGRDGTHHRTSSDRMRRTMTIRSFPAACSATARLMDANTLRV